jgi:hypothetical protein
MRQRLLIRGATGLLAAVALVMAIACGGALAWADDSSEPVAVDESAECALTVVEEGDDVGPIEGVAFSLYRVAKFATADTFEYVGGFTGWDEALIDTSELSVMDTPWDVRADTIAAMIRSRIADSAGVSAEARGMTDDEGGVEFDGLEPGLYLLVANPLKSNGLLVTTQPALLTLPAQDEASGAWEYSTEVEAKNEIQPYDDEIITTFDLTVAKVWSDSGHEAERPSELTVVLYCDGAQYETATINADGNWRCSWAGLDAGSEWTVVERDAPDEYLWTVTREGNLVTLTNKYREVSTPESSSSTTTTTTPTVMPGGPTSTTPTTPTAQTVPDATETLPQTGQPWWPVSVLVVGGVGLFALGWLITASERRKYAKGAATSARRHR